MNACPFKVHSNIVHAPRPGAPKGEDPEEIYSVLGSGVEVEHPFVHDPNMGISWKLWTEEAAGPVQFEWTWKPDEKKVWWDLSMIDAAGDTASGTEAADSTVTNTTTGAADVSNVRRGEGSLLGVSHPFAAYGLSLRPHRDGNGIEMEGICGRIDCPAGEEVCWQAYNAWNDWGKQHDCGEDVGLRFVLCG